MKKEKIEVDFRHQIKCALNDQIPWPVLKTFLDNMTTTLEKSKKVIDILFEELQILNLRQNTVIEQSTVLDQEHTNNGSDANSILTFDILKDTQLDDVNTLEKAMEKILKQVEDESARWMEHFLPGSRIDQLNSFLYKDKE